MFYFSFEKMEIRTAEHSIRVLLNLHKLCRTLPRVPLDQQMNASLTLPRFVRTLIVGFALFVCATCTPNRTEPPRSTDNRVLTAPTGASVTVEPEDGQWTMPAKNYASTRFSGLEDINTGNVASLKLAWSFSTGVLRGHEAAPIIANNTMYVITPYPNIVYALDLTHEPA